MNFKSFAALASVLSVSSVAFAQAPKVLAAEATVIDMGRAFENIDLVDGKVNYGSPILVLVPTESAAPRVEVLADASSQCLEVVSTIRFKPEFKQTLIVLEPEFNDDDGLNQCDIKVIQPSGKSATISLGYYIAN